MKNISLPTIVTCLLLFLVTSSMAQNKPQKAVMGWIDVLSIDFSPTTVHADKYLRGSKKWAFGAIQAGLLKPAKGFRFSKSKFGFLLWPDTLKIGDIAGEFKKESRKLQSERSVAKVPKGFLPVFIVEYQDGDDLLFKHIGQAK